jgi:hypothetical protein
MEGDRVMTPSNPFRPNSYQAKYYDARVSEIESAQTGVAAAMLDLPEQAEFRREWTKRLVDEVEPAHGHVGVHARVDLAARDALAARIHEQRGEMRMPTPEPVWLRVQVNHPQAGLLRLRTDGEAWVLRIRGSDLGVGVVQRGEITNGVVQPRAEIVDVAAERALSDPWGPESPVGSPVFASGPDGEPIEVNAADLNITVEPVPPRADLSVIEKFRQRLRGLHPKGDPS